MRAEYRGGALHKCVCVCVSEPEGSGFVRAGEELYLVVVLAVLFCGWRSDRWGQNNLLFFLP